MFHTDTVTVVLLQSNRSATEQTDASVDNSFRNDRAAVIVQLFPLHCYRARRCHENCYKAFLSSDWPRRVCTDTDNCEWMLSCTPLVLLLLPRPLLLLLLLSDSSCLASLTCLLPCLTCLSCLSHSDSVDPNLRCL